MEAKIKALEALIREEKAIVASTQSARTEGIQGLGKIAESQQSTRQLTSGSTKSINSAGSQNPSSWKRMALIFM